jgi:WD40 repeat protein
MSERKPKRPQSTPKSKPFTDIGDSPVPGFTLRHVLRGHTRYIYHIAWSPNGKVLATSSKDQTIRLWDSYSGELLKVARGHVRDVTQLAWSPDGEILASGSWDKTICLWDTKTWQVLREKQINSVYSLTWSPNGNTLAWGAADKTVWVWDIRTGAVHQTPAEHNHSAFALVWSKDGQTLYSGDDHGVIRSWNIHGEKPFQVIPKGRANELTLSPDGQRLAGAYDRTIQIWDSTTWNVLTILEGHTAVIDHLAFSHNGFYRRGVRAAERRVTG